jgi:hypothetical protein
MDCIFVTTYNDKNAIRDSMIWKKENENHLYDVAHYSTLY